MSQLLDAADRYPIPTFVLAFVIFATLIRYFRFYLPWGYCLALLPPEEAAKHPRASLSELEKRAEKPKTGWVEAASWVALLGAAAGAALLLRQHLLQSYSVRSSSMLPSFELGDELALSRKAYSNGRLPARGEVVVFHHDGQQDVVKRVIGLPGDEIRMHGGFPIINGWEAPHCDVGRYVHIQGEAQVDGRIFVEFLAGKAYLTLHVPPARPFESYVVKAGEVFVLGDNRNQSLDSRNWIDDQPSGIALTSLVGRVERFVLGRKRSGELDYASLLSPLAFQWNADGMDMSDAQRKLSECLKGRPENTEPPRPAAAAPLSRLGALP